MKNTILLFILTNTYIMHHILHILESVTPLKDYLKSKGVFTVGGTVSDKLLIFDVDGTLINTTARIKLNRYREFVKYISNAEFNDYKLRAGEKFDFDEFDDEKILSKETFTPYWDTLKREYQKGTHICILTARGNADMIRKFFLNNGIDIKKELVFAVGDPKFNLKGSVQDKKAKIIERLACYGYQTMIFFDDNEGNLKSAMQIGKKLNIKIHTVKV